MSEYRAICFIALITRLILLFPLHNHFLMSENITRFNFSHLIEDLLFCGADFPLIFALDILLKLKLTTG